MKSFAIVALLLALAFAKDEPTEFTLASVKACEAKECIPTYTKAIADYSDSDKTDLATETAAYNKCMTESYTKKDSPCQGFNDMTKKVTAEQFAACQNDCGSNLVNSASVEELACTCTKCADSAKCSSQVLAFVGALVALIALVL